jgi:hypothetical protein
LLDSSQAHQILAEKKRKAQNMLKSLNSINSSVNNHSGRPQANLSAYISPKGFGAEVPFTQKPVSSTKNSKVVA